MKYFAVIRERGSGWNASLTMREQRLWEEHAAFMNSLAAEGSVILGGPLGEGDKRFLIIFDAESEKAIEERLALDPWTRTRLLQITMVEAWEILLEKTC